MTLSSFHWILPEQLVGSGKPGLSGDFKGDLQALWQQGIRVILTLLEEPLAIPENPPQLIFLHFPIVDMQAPQKLQAVHTICSKVSAHIQAKEAVLIHCEAGTGRTGTILACCLIHQGRTAEEALLEIRKIDPLYVRNSLQENFVRRYETFYRFH